MVYIILETCLEKLFIGVTQHYFSCQIIITWVEGQLHRLRLTTFWHIGWRDGNQAMLDIKEIEYNMWCLDGQCHYNWSNFELIGTLFIEYIAFGINVGEFVEVNEKDHEFVTHTFCVLVAHGDDLVDVRPRLGAPLICSIHQSFC